MNFLQPLDDVLERPFTAIKDVNTFVIGFVMQSVTRKVVKLGDWVVPTTPDRLGQHFGWVTVALQRR